MPKYWMISLRDQNGIGNDRNPSGPTFWVSDKTQIDRIENWRKLTFAEFRKALIAACDEFPDLPQDSQQEEKHVVMAVHGYNNGWDQSIHFYQRINDSLFSGKKGMGICILLTWPSKGQVYDYLADRQEVRKCADDLADILDDFYEILARNQTAAAADPAKACKAKTSMIAHSMGNFLAQMALFHLWKRRNSPLSMSFVNQLLMVAADVDNDIFDSGNQIGDGDGEGIANLSYRVTALYSGRDPVLGVSAGLKHFLKRRLGRSGLDRTSGDGHVPTPDNVWDTDCTEFFDKLSDPEIHGGYFDAAKAPRAFELMRQVLRGIDRAVLVENGTASKKSWWPNKLP